VLLILIPLIYPEALPKAAIDGAGCATTATTATATAAT
jgi:hypothetical protein